MGGGSGRFFGGSLMRRSGNRSGSGSDGFSGGGLGGIAVAILATVFAIGGELNNFFRVVQTWLGNA